MLKRTFLAITAVAALSVAAPVLAQTPTEGTPMSTPTKSGYAPVNGVEVFYQVYGKGDPIVLLHGGFGAIEMFGPMIGALAENHTVIGMDLQAHGRTAPMDRPMTFEAMAADVAGLITFLGYEKADVLGYSTGGGVALRLGIDHPEVIDKLILVSTPFAKEGWHQYNLDGMAMIGPGSAEGMKQTPMYELFAAVNPDPDTNWPKLHEKQGGLVNAPYDYSAELKDGLKVPTMLVDGDWDSVRMAHIVEFFALLGGGLVDAGWDGSNMNQNRLAILPGQTHYSIFMSPELATTTLSFIDAK
jgi:pimeloyl-ACP methyl ester carboxylesterase